MKEALKLVFISHGVKNPSPFPKADCYIDCRGVPNPCYNPSLDGTGDDPKVIKWVREKLGNDFVLYEGMIRQGLGKLLTRRKGENPYERPFIVCCMCAHGVHRSRAMKHLLAERFGELYLVEVK